MAATFTYTTLIQPEQLAGRLSDPEVAIIDCRFELTRPDWGAGAYAAGHVPRALYAHLDRDLSGPVSPQTGRHPLPQIGSLVSTFSRWGIDERVQVVAYDQGNGAYAARLWWLLRSTGHLAVAVLDGGFAAWQQAGLPVDTAPSEPPTESSSARGARLPPLDKTLDSVGPGVRQPRQFVARAPVGGVVTTAELERALATGELARGETLLIDARGADRFAGKNETIDPVAGHVPGARSHPLTRNIDAQGRFLPADELRSRFEQTLRGRSAERVISMCGSGVTACHNLLAMQIAGLSGARLYAGSWSEWIRDPARPVSCEPDTLP